MEELHRMLNIHHSRSASINIITSVASMRRTLNKETTVSLMIVPKE
jgi:hypothetical protein